MEGDGWPTPSLCGCLLAVLLPRGATLHEAGGNERGTQPALEKADV